MHIFFVLAHWNSMFHTLTPTRHPQRNVSVQLISKTDKLMHGTEDSRFPARQTISEEMDSDLQSRHRLLKRALFKLLRRFAIYIVLKIWTTAKPSSFQTLFVLHVFLEAFTYSFPLKTRRISG